MIGYNTDYNAAMDCLEMRIGEVGADPSPLKGKRVLVLGAGGVARPIVFGLRKRGATITIASRTMPRPSGWPTRSRRRRSSGRPAIARRAT